MKKSKLYVISSLAVTMIVSLVLGFAFLTVTKSEIKSVSADGTIRIYFVNEDTSSWTGGSNLYAWKGSGGSGNENAGWPGVAMTYIGDEVYYADISADYTNIKISSKNNGGYYIETSDNLFDNSVFGCKSGVGAKHWGSFEDVFEVDYTLYYFDKLGWSNVYMHLYNNDAAFTTFGTSDVSMTLYDEDLGLYKADVYKKKGSDNSLNFDKVIFNNGNGGDGNQSATLAIDKLKVYNTYYWSFDNAVDAYGIDFDKYYVVGTLHGETSWDPILDRAMGAGSGSDKAQLKTTMDNGDTIKIWYRGNMYGGSDFNNGNPSSVSTSNGSNVSVTANGLYFISLNGHDQTWISAPGIALQATKSKLSNDGNYLLLMTGFDLSSLGEDLSGYEIGYSIVKNSESADTSSMGTEYYTNVLVLTESGSALVDSTVLYGSDAYKLIVYEISGCKAGDSFSVTAQITYNGTVVARGTTVTGAVPAE